MATKQQKGAARPGRPPSTETQRGTREMRTRVPYELAEQITAAAESEGRTVANWLAEAARQRLSAR